MQIETGPAPLESTLVYRHELPLHFESLSLTELAVRSGFIKRQPKKITPEGFFYSFFQDTFSENHALRNIAIAVGIYEGCTVAKQSVDYRINDGFITFLEHILAATLMQQSGVKVQWAQTSDAFRPFHRVLLQDSTTLPLAPELVSEFPGPSNKYGQSATAKIQAVMDILTEQFCHLELGAFTENDQSKALDILQIAQPGDLVIRDLGYFVLQAFEKMSEQSIFFLSRLRYGVSVYDPETGEKMDLLKELQTNSCLDIKLQMGAKERVLVRVVAQPVSEEILAERIQKAKTDRDLRLKHDNKYMALLAWDIFVTNVPAQIWTASQARTVNQVRWRIECVFKTWKSHFKLNALPEGTATRIKAHIYAALIFVTMFQKYCYKPVANAAYEKHNIDISIIKLAQFIKEHSWLLLILPYNPQLKEAIVKQVLYHCKYDKRKRKSYPQKFRSLF